MLPAPWPRRIGVSLEEERHTHLLDQLRESLELLAGKSGKKASPASAHCVCCGSAGHYRRDCKQRNKVCNNCGVSGHLATVCRSAAKAPKNLPKERVPGAPRASYAAVTAGSAWVCPRCDRLGECGLTACQVPGCGGKRQKEVAVPPVPKPFVPRSGAAGIPPLTGEAEAARKDLQIRLDSLTKARQVLVESGHDATVLDPLLATLAAEQQSLAPKPPTLLDSVHAEQSRLTARAKLITALTTRDAKYRKTSADLQTRLDGLGAKRADARAALEAELKAKLQSTEEHYDAKEAQIKREILDGKEQFLTANAAQEAELEKLHPEDTAPALPDASQRPSVAQPGTPEGARQSPQSNPCDRLDAAGKARFALFMAVEQERMRVDAAAREDGDEFMNEPPAQEPKANARDLEDGEVSDPKRTAK
jgi:hypothetical protein